MKKVLFIDRDGTIIKEPPVTFQVDSLEQLEFLPFAISNLRKITEELDYELVIVTNQDGLGTASNPLENFEKIQDKMLTVLKNEGVEFSAIHIDASFEKDNLPTRKPGTGLLQQYFSAAYDLKNSVVIGDRLTDVQLAVNLGSKSILIQEKEMESDVKPDLLTNDWNRIYEWLRKPPRSVTHERNTSETSIKIELNLDGSGQSAIETGLGFFDHMLEQISRHGNVDLNIKTKGDLHIDEHHTIEDTGIALGEAFNNAIGDKKGLDRYGFCLPMDDCLAQVAIDFGGRNWIEWDVKFNREKIGDMPTEMFFHFFKSFSDAARCNLNIKAEGENEHHKIEAIFKAFAKAIKMAIARTGNMNQIPSTKGIL
jgi:imidazoleglycerol-phosphate dehydratase / histidinol-phosphatase